MNFKFLKRLLILIISCVLIFYIGKATKRYILVNRTVIGNYIISNKSFNEKLKEGNKNCKCDSLKITVNKKVIIKYDNIVDSILSDSVKYDRLLYYLFNYKDNINSLVMPKMKYSKAQININDIAYKAKIKLSGGQYDHFDTEKRSLRIKFKKDLYSGMSKFNLYNPKVRNGGIYEWIGFKLLEQENFIALNTGYLNVFINNKNKGVYYFEEQPTNNTLIANNKLPGIIVRVNFTGVSFNITNYYDSKSPLLKDDYKNQQELLNKKLKDFKDKKIQIEQLFSIPKFAKFAAIISLINGYHGSQFRNIYFYFNPKDSLLEPIGREFATNLLNEVRQNEFPYYLEFNKFKAKKSFRINKTFYLKGNNTGLFKKLYYAHLEKIIEPEFLDIFFNKIEKELENRQACLYKAEPYFKSFDKNHYYKNQNLIKLFLKKKELNLAKYVMLNSVNK